MIRASPDEPGRPIAGRFPKLARKPYSSDRFAAYARGKKAPVRQAVHPRMLRKAEYPAAGAIRRLRAAGQIAYGTAMLRGLCSPE